MKKNNNYHFLFSIALSLAALLFIYIQPTHEQQLTEVAYRSLPKAVMVSVVIREPKLVIKLGDIEVYRSTETIIQGYAGSGVLISPNGHILTCDHLFRSGEVLAIAVKDIEGTTYPAELLFQERSRDLALLKTEIIDQPYALLAKSDSLRIGQEVIAIGNPLELEFSVTHGIISYLDRHFRFSCSVTQSDTFINPGNSGGPLFNLNGELVGINSFIFSPSKQPVFSGLGFSVQPSEIRAFLGRFKGLEVVK